MQPNTIELSVEGARDSLCALEAHLKVISDQIVKKQAEHAKLRSAISELKTAMENNASSKTGSVSPSA